MTDLISNFNSGINQLSVVTSIEGHAVVPEVLEEVRQDLVHNVLRLHAVSTATLFHYLQQKQRHFKHIFFFKFQDPKLKQIRNNLKS